MEHFLKQGADIDTRGILPGAPDTVRDRDLPDGTWVDEWGVSRRLSPNGYYYELTGSPMAGPLTMADVEAYFNALFTPLSHRARIAAKVVRRGQPGVPGAAGGTRTSRTSRR